jgi:secreted PhoX family phosphatase
MTWRRPASAVGCSSRDWPRPAPWSGAWPSPFSQGWTSQPGRFFDDVSLPDGFTYDVVASYRDRIGDGEYFGYNNDFTAYFPLRDRHGDEEGLLWVNHEYADPFFIHGNPNPETKTARQIELEQYSVGGSVIRVERKRDGSGRSSATGATPDASPP